MKKETKIKCKKIALLTVFLTVSLTSPLILSQNCTYTWSQQNSHTSNLLLTCKAVNELVCWAAGANSTVLRTTDGGNTWINANPNFNFTGNVYNMEAIDANTAWVTIETQTTTAIYKTSNGGNSWNQVYSNTAGFIKGIRMLSLTDGIAIGNPISELWNILLTTDGGNTWHSSPNRPSANNIHQAVHNCFQVSMPNIYWGTSIATIFRSTDGGITYTEPETPGAGNYIFSLRVNPSGIGMAAGIAMCRSTNGGAAFLPHPAMGTGNINGIEGAGTNFWYVRGTKIYSSIDNGTSWSENYTAPLTITHIDFPDNLSGCQMGWAVGYGGTIHKMTGSLTSSGNNHSSFPASYELKQNYPNPFNPETIISFSLPKAGFTSLRVYDVTGNEIAILLYKEMAAGEYSVKFAPEDLSSGIYFYTLSSGSFRQSYKMILTK